MNRIATTDPPAEDEAPTSVAGPITRGRLLVAGGGVLLQLALGAAYTWSVFSRALQDPDSVFSLTPSQASLPFSVMIGTVFLGTLIGGRLQDRRGPRPVAIGGGALFGLGFLLAGTATGPDDLWLIVLGVGVVSGFGMGCAYIVPVAMLQKWFPDRRGLITGVAVGGFGFGAVLVSPVAAWLVEYYSGVPTRAFLWLGPAFVIVTVVGASVFRNPPGSGGSGGALSGHTPAEALRTGTWYLLTLIFTVSILAGISLISVIAFAAEDIAGYGVAAAATLTGVMGLFNGSGRVLWGWLSEKTGRMPAFAAMLGIQGLCLLLLPHAGAPVAFFVLAALIYLAYGGGFGVMPAAAGDYFGLRHAGAIYGLMIVAWSIGGLVGPQLVSRLTENGGYTTAFTVIAGCALAAAALPVLLHRRTRAIAQRPTTTSGLDETRAC